MRQCDVDFIDMYVLLSTENIPPSRPDSDDQYNAQQILRNKQQPQVLRSSSRYLNTNPRTSL